MLLALDEERQPALEHEVNLLLPRVAVDTTALAGLEHQLVHPEAGHAERSAQRHEALTGSRIQPRARDPRLHYHES